MAGATQVQSWLEAHTRAEQPPLVMTFKQSAAAALVGPTRRLPRLVSGSRARQLRVSDDANESPGDIVQPIRGPKLLKIAPLLPVVSEGDGAYGNAFMP